MPSIQMKVDDRCGVCGDKVEEKNEVIGMVIYSDLEDCWVPHLVHELCRSIDIPVK